MCISGKLKLFLWDFLDLFLGKTLLDFANLVSQFNHLFICHWIRVRVIFLAFLKSFLKLQLFFHSSLVMLLRHHHSPDEFFFPPLHLVCHSLLFLLHLHRNLQIEILVYLWAIFLGLPFMLHLLAHHPHLELSLFFLMLPVTLAALWLSLLLNYFLLIVIHFALEFIVLLLVFLILSSKTMDYHVFLS